MLPYLAYTKALPLTLLRICTSSETMSTQTIDVDAILFDMDGTLVDSTAAVNETYIKFCKEHVFEITSHPHVRGQICTHELG